ncbi:MAG: hypothetical protein AB7U29_16890, partial [Desulfobulbus sp.]
IQRISQGTVEQIQQDFLRASRSFVCTAQKIYLFNKVRHHASSLLCRDTEKVLSQLMGWRREHSEVYRADTQGSPFLNVENSYRELSPFFIDKPTPSK